MKRLSLILSLVFSLIFSSNFFSQENKSDIIYIKYDPSIDKHFNRKGEVNYFDIYIKNNLHKTFQYGTSNTIKKTKFFNKKISTREALYQLIKKDSPSKIIVFYIVKKENNNYHFYKADYLIRTIRD